MQMPPINRRQFLTGLLGTAALPSAFSVRSQPKRPATIVFILADDMRWDALGAAGNRALQTPNLDWLASSGHHFKNNFVTTSICPSSRASIMMSEYSGRHGIWDFSTPLSDRQQQTSLPFLLRQNGYQTAFFGKWGIGEVPPVNLFDHWLGFMGQGEYFSDGHDGHLTDSLSHQVTSWLKTNKRNQPLALFISTKAPHVQDEIPGGFLPAHRHSDLYADVNFELPRSATTEEFSKLPSFLQSSEGRRRWQSRFSSPQRYQQTCRQYHRLIKGIDDLTGSVIDTLQAKNQLAESLIAFTSDNGFLLGEHGLAGKWWGFEESIRTPLILKLPDAMGQSNKKDIQEISLNIDIAPTILDSAGISRPDTMQGQSLLPRMQDRQYAGRKDFLYEHLFKHPRIARTIGLRSEKYKYLRYPDQDQKHEMLFDLQSDPFELENLVNKSQHHRALEALRSRTLELELVNQLPTQG
jgi:arylsulfatase A-like enzyme